METVSNKFGLASDHFTSYENLVESIERRLFSLRSNAQLHSEIYDQTVNELYKKFKKLNTEIYGVSRDSLKSHEGFKEKYKYPFELISDPDEKLCNLFDVIKEKNMYGKKYIGIERSTFLIDKEGKLCSEWRKVKVNVHAEEVLEEIKKLD